MLAPVSACECGGCSGASLVLIRRSQRVLPADLRGQTARPALGRPWGAPAGRAKRGRCCLARPVTGMGTAGGRYEPVAPVVALCCQQTGRGVRPGLQRLRQPLRQPRRQPRRPSRSSGAGRREIVRWGDWLCDQSTFPAVDIERSAVPDLAGVKPRTLGSSFAMPRGGVAAVPVGGPVDARNTVRDRVLR